MLWEIIFIFLNMAIKKDIEFLFEIGSMRFLERTWKRFLGADFANVSEHTFRVIWIAMILAKYEKAKNIERIALMALIHDVSESRTGDVNYLYRCYTERKETEAFEDIFHETSIFSDIKKAWKEYEERESIESKIAICLTTKIIITIIRRYNRLCFGIKRKKIIVAKKTLRKWGCFSGWR